MMPRFLLKAPFEIQQASSVLKKKNAQWDVKLSSLSGQSHRCKSPCLKHEAGRQRRLGEPNLQVLIMKQSLWSSSLYPVG